MVLNVKIDAFEGPFDLLFHLIEKNKIDIYDIPIAELTQQYLSYLSNMTKKELDTASEFLLMASTLLNIKSKVLLPCTQVEDVKTELAITKDEDPRSELMNKLLEYKKYKELSLVLKSKEQKQSRVFKRPPADLSNLWSDEFILPAITFDQLVSSFDSLVNKKKLRENPTKIKKETMPLYKKVKEIYEIINRVKSNILFCSLLKGNASRKVIITTFLAVLELIKMNCIFAFQEKQFGEIVLANRRD